MDKAFTQAAEQYCSQLASEIETRIPGTRVKDLGWLLVISLPNKSTFTLNVLSANAVDVTGEDCLGKHWEFAGISWQQAVDTLAKVNRLTPPTNEDTNTAAVSPVAEPTGINQPGLAWWTGKYPVGHQSASLAESDERDQTGRKNARRDFPFGEDCLGRLDMHKRAEGRGSLSEASGSNAGDSSPDDSRAKMPAGASHVTESIGGDSRVPYGAELFKHLAEVLPVGEDEAWLDDAGNFNVAVEPVRVRIIPKGANLYDVETFVGDSRQPRQVQLPHGETIRYVFDLVSMIEKLNHPTSGEAGDDGSEEVDPGDAYEVLAELAGELGRPQDFIRNKDLLSLRAGLTEGKTRQTAPDALLCGLDAHLRRFADLKQDGQGSGAGEAAKPKWFRGAPVSLGGGMEGKTLRYVQGVGAVIVEKKDLPDSGSMKLSWKPEQGAVLVPLAEITKRPSWKPPGWKF